MKKHSKNISKEIDDLFDHPPTVNQKAWGIINEFYHLILTHMEKQNISRADLAKKLDRSRSAISQMFNKTPNITVRKMVEIADSIGLDIDVVPSYLKKEIGKKPETKYIIIPVSSNYLSKEIVNRPKSNIISSEKYPYTPSYNPIFTKCNELPI